MEKLVHSEGNEGREGAGEGEGNHLVKEEEGEDFGGCG